jgi:methoxymalonate biosynthesis acyl carrier protein
MSGAAREKIRAFIIQSLQLKDIEDDDNMFEAGLVHSLFAMQIIIFIEKEFGIELELDQVQLENLASIDAITELVETSSVPAVAQGGS